VWIVSARAHHRIDVDVKVSMFGEQLQFLIQHLQGLFGDVIRHHVIDADLQMVKTGAVQALNAVRGEQITVGDQARQNGISTDVRNDLVELRVQQRLATAERDNGGSQARQLIDAVLHDVQSDRLGKIVVLVAIFTGEIAAANWDDVRQHRVVG